MRYLILLVKASTIRTKLFTLLVICPYEFPVTHGTGMKGSDGTEIKGSDKNRNKGSDRTGLKRSDVTG